MYHMTWMDTAPTGPYELLENSEMCYCLIYWAVYKQNSDI